MSFPAASGLSLADLSLSADRRYRRFSNASDAISCKLSTTIGWRTVSVQEVVTQAKSLCGQHIRTRLKRFGFVNRRLGLQRLCSVANLSGGQAVCDVFIQLDALSMELERLHPKLYTGVSRQMGLTLASEKSITKMLSSMAHDIFRTDISWFKIASFYGLVSGAAVDCVCQGHPEYLYSLVEAAGLIIERDIANWIGQQGGWSSMLSKFRCSEYPNVFQLMALSVVGLIVVIVSTAILLRSLGNLVFFNLYQS